MAGMQAVYYRAPDGSEPVVEFIEALRDPDRQAVNWTAPGSVGTV